jgi:hypothetical protein
MDNTKPPTETGTSDAGGALAVDDGIELLDRLETMHHARAYPRLFARTGELACSQIRRARPHLVVLCGRIENPDGSGMVAMRELGPDTRGIPPLSHTPGRRARPERCDAAACQGGGHLGAGWPDAADARMIHHD